jgi:hypothetical protein
MARNPWFPRVSRESRQPVRLTISRYADPFPAGTVPRQVLAIIASCLHLLLRTRMMDRVE